MELLIWGRDVFLLGVVELTSGLVGMREVVVSDADEGGGH